VLRHDALRTSVSNNFVHIRRTGIRRNGIRRNGAEHVSDILEKMHFSANGLDTFKLISINQKW